MGGLVGLRPSVERVDHRLKGCVECMDFFKECNDG
jgi:hypothetical protein